MNVEKGDRQVARGWEAWDNLHPKDKRFPGPLRLYNHHHGIHPADRVEDECIYLATDAEVLAYAATLDGAVPLRLCLQHMDTDDGTSMECRMVEGLWFPLPDRETTDE